MVVPFVETQTCPVNRKVSYILVGASPEFGVQYLSSRSLTLPKWMAAKKGPSRFTLRVIVLSGDKNAALLPP